MLGTGKANSLEAKEARPKPPPQSLEPLVSHHPNCQRPKEEEAVFIALPEAVLYHKTLTKADTLHLLKPHHVSRMPGLVVGNPAHGRGI